MVSLVKIFYTCSKAKFNANTNYIFKLFLEYLKSFLTKNVDKSIIKICKDKLEDILKENQNLDYDADSNSINERLDEDKLAD